MKKVVALSLKRAVVVVLVLITGLFLTASSAQSTKSGDILRAGAAKIGITPEKPVKMAGYAARKGLSEGIHDPLSARVVAFENNGKRLVLVSTDLLGFYNKTAEPLREAIINEFKLKPSELFLSAIHTRQPHPDRR
jgi:neutral ceramidase